MRPGERVVLRSTPPPLGLDGLARRFTGGADTLDILELRAAEKLAASAPVPARLVDIPRLDPAQAVRTRTFRLGDFEINGAGMNMNRVDATVVKGTVDVWRVTNRDGSPHSFHVHGVQFQVSAVDGQSPPPELAGWKDTVYLPPNRPIDLVIRFGQYADPNTPYMFHCHVLYHEDQGMMGQFVVVEPGQRAGSLEAPGSPGEHHHGS